MKGAHRQGSQKDSGNEPKSINDGSEDATPARPPRFPSFDGLRAIAALTVVAVHVGFVSGVTPRAEHGVGIYIARLEIGVAVFFLISGFLLYRPFVVAHLAGERAPRTGAFFIRRLLRIVPAYWLALFVTTSLLRVGADIGPGGWIAYASHYFFGQIYFADQAFKGISAAWSLCVEMTFYAFVPVFAALLGASRSRRSDHRALRREVVGIVSLVALSVIWRFGVIAVVPVTSPYRHLAMIWLPAELDLFALGMSLAVASAWYHHRGREPRVMATRWMPWISWTLAAGCFWAVSQIGASVDPVYQVTSIEIAKQSLYGLFAFFLIAPAVFGPLRLGLIRRFLQAWPVMGVGLISYGIYLWHQTWVYELIDLRHLKLFTIAFWPFFGTVIAATMATALVSYAAIERPILHFKNALSWFSARRSGAPKDSVNQ
ncbi:MAG: acyltransferase [Actinomycetes bacterium]